MSALLLSNSIWALPAVTLVTVPLFVLIFARTSWGHSGDWHLVDLIWIGTSAVTLYFLAIGIIFEQHRNTGQVAIANYAGHIKAGVLATNANLEEFCIGASPRRLTISAAARDTFCSLNALYLGRFNEIGQRYESGQTISRFTQLPDMTSDTLSREVGEDAILTIRRWERVRNEADWLNENADGLRELQGEVSFSSAMKGLRIFWMYLFSIIIALRLSKPIFEIWFKNRAAESTGVPTSE